MAITKVTEGVRTLGTGEVLTANMGTDPTNASNLSSGDVPLAQLGNAPETDVTAINDDIALLAFRTQANGSLARYNLVDQSVDSFEDASGVDSGASSGATRDSTGKFYSSAAPATGGTVTTVGDYTVHSFTATGDTDFVVGSSGNVDALIVAGGGAAGKFSGGGGGAGGFRTSASHAVTAQTYTITVGAGGVPLEVYGQGGSGGDSVFDTVTSAGGSGGVGYHSGSTDPAPYPGNAGGSGGGSGSGTAPAPFTGYGGNTPSTSPAQGFGGGNSAGRQSNNNYSGGGGGGGASEVGAGGATVDGSAICNAGGAGGDGIQNDYRTGSDVYYAGGGGGGIGDSYPYGQNTIDGGAGGAGGGGAGTTLVAYQANSSAAGEDGTANTGGGGGGGALGNGGAGGTGIVVIRYPTGDLGSIAATMSLVSNAQTAQDGAPDNGDLVITYTNETGTATINTDIKAYISRDGSAYTSAVTLVSQGTTGGHTILTANGVDLSGITSGTSMRWKIETLNQSASKETRIQAVSLGWS